MESKSIIGYMVFGWTSNEPKGGMKDFLGTVKSLNRPWELARLDRMDDENWEWMVDFIEVYDRDTFDQVGSWWVGVNGKWQPYRGVRGA